MISVTISINGEPIFTRSAHRRTEFHKKDGKDCYLVDDGQLVYHNTEDGAIELAHKLLDTIVENADDAEIKKSQKTGKPVKPNRRRSAESK